MQDNLFDPKKFHNPISIEGFDLKTLKKILNLMLIIRKTEQHLAYGRKEGFIGGPVHLGVGQEAIGVGITHNLTKNDRIFGGHRSHSHLLALNPDIYKLFAEVLCRVTGFSKGMGGSMHLFDQSNGFYGSTPIVAGTVPLAVGAALASKMQNLDDIAVSYFGDGAVEEGVVHECFNLAKVLNVPVLFVIENNLFSSHMHISLRQPSSITSRFAKANHIPHKLIDGNDVTTVIRSSKDLINTMRKDKGPAILELITYRWYGHVDWRDDIDVGVARSTDDLKNWKLRDPISRLSQTMISNNIWTTEQEVELHNKINNKIKTAWEKAIGDPYPSKESILKYVYHS